MQHKHRHALVMEVVTASIANTSILPRQAGPSHLLPFFVINAEACFLVSPAKKHTGKVFRIGPVE